MILKRYAEEMPAFFNISVRRKFCKERQERKKRVSELDIESWGLFLV